MDLNYISPFELNLLFKIMYLYNKNTYLLLNTILYTYSIFFVDNIYDIYTRLILYLYLNNKDYKFDQLSIQIEPDLKSHPHSYEPYKVKLFYTDIINNNYIITFDDLCELLEPRLENSGYYLNASEILILKIVI